MLQNTTLMHCFTSVGSSIKTSPARRRWCYRRAGDVSIRLLLSIYSDFCGWDAEHQRVTNKARPRHQQRQRHQPLLDRRATQNFVPSFLHKHLWSKVIVKCSTIPKLYIYVYDLLSTWWPNGLHCRHWMKRSRVRLSVGLNWKINFCKLVLVSVFYVITLECIPLLYCSRTHSTGHTLVWDQVIDAVVWHILNIIISLTQFY